MTDELLRGLERRWRDTGAPNDLEALIVARKRAGQGQERFAECREELMKNANDANARRLIAKYDPLAWTGYVTIDRGVITVTEPGRSFRRSVRDFRLSVPEDACFERIRYANGALYASAVLDNRERWEAKIESDLILQAFDFRAPFYQTAGLTIDMHAHDEEERSEFDLDARTPNARQRIRMVDGFPIFIQDQMAYISGMGTRTEGYFRGAHVREPQPTCGPSIKRYQIDNYLVPQTPRIANSDNKVLRHEDLAVGFNSIGVFLLEVPSTVIDALSIYATLDRHQ